LSVTRDGKKETEAKKEEAKVEKKTEELHGTVVIYRKSYQTEPLL